MTRLIRWFSLLLLGASLVRDVRAQFATSPHGDYGDLEYPEPFEEKATQKKPHWFRHPARKTPEATLEYANWLRSQPWGRRDAARQYDRLVREWPDSREAVAAQLAYADILYERGKYESAFEEYQYLIDRYVGNFPYEKVLDRQFRIAQTIMTTRRGSFLFFPGFVAPERALPLFRKIVENAPGWERAPQAQFFVGAIYEETQQYDEAKQAYEAVMLRYPDSNVAENAGFRRAACLYTVARKRTTDEKGCRQALTALSSYLNSHPDSENAELAKQYRDELVGRLTKLYFERAEYYDKTARRPEAALMAYKDFVRECPASDLVQTANQRIAELENELESSHE